MSYRDYMEGGRYHPAMRRDCACDSLKAEVERQEARARDMKRRWLAVQDESNEKSDRITTLEAALREVETYLRKSGVVCGHPHLPGSYALGVVVTALGAQQGKGEPDGP